MTGKRVVLSAQARHEVRQITAWYRQEGGASLAGHWADAVASTLRHIEAHPQAGSPRYAIELRIDGLRCWTVKGFPYLVFYLDYAQHIDVGRVLHAQRDIPTWLNHPNESQEH